MTITVSGSVITFSDSTTQSTAASASSYAGAGGQVFTSSGTFTIPTGVTKLKVSVVGGGGSGGYSIECAGNYSGNSGNTSSVASGTQTISTISATGGGGGYISSPASYGLGGGGSGGDLNMYGAAGPAGSSGPGGAISSMFGSFGYFNHSPVYGGGGTYSNFNGNAIGTGGSGGVAIKYLTGLTAGNTLAVTVGTGGSSAGGSQAGANGVVVFEW
jgi:hypothetical protein